MKKSVPCISLLFLFFFTAILQAQTTEAKLIENFREYFSIQKEVAYLHLNKSVLLQGEQLGIAAYVVNKSDLKPSDITSNLYVQIANAQGEVLKQEVLLVEGGVASSVYDIDSDFLPGDYTITAFTNWMRNFDEQNYFTEKIKVLESNVDFQDNSKNSLEIDAQFLPESGHLLNSVLNVVGVVVRDRSGHGVPNAIVQVTADGKPIGTVELNKMGIGKFSFVPNEDQDYKAVVIIDTKEHPVSFTTRVEESGVVLSATQRNTELLLQVITNARSLEKIGKKNFILAVQGRNALETYPINFEERESIPMIFDFNRMDPGINIITLFDEGLNPIAERLVFNYTGLPVDSMQQPQSFIKGDSLDLKLSFHTPTDRNLSVSILPENTISYQRNHNILSYLFLQPFVKAAIEKGGWYFENIDKRKKYELDNLLLTQGWSSYDWTSIFESKRELKYPEENNFSFEAQIVNEKFSKRDQRYVVHPTSINPIDYFVIPKGNNKFIYDGFKASEGDTLAMSRLRKNNDLLPSALNLRFFPSKFPDFGPTAETFPQVAQKVEKAGFIAQPAFKKDTLKGYEELGEVLLEHTRDKEQERERKLNRSAFSSASVITEEDRRMYQTLGQYLTFMNLQVVEEAGDFKVYSRGEEVAFFLDDNRVFAAGYFFNFPLSYVDYLSIDRSGISGSVSFGKPSIKIYTDKEGKHASFNDRNRIQKFAIPLKYSRKKTFYTPKYENHSDHFFKEFGVIGWKVNLRSKNGEDILISIPMPEVDFKLIIEGFTSNGTLIHEVHTIPVQSDL